MKIVDRKTFLAMPAGVLYSNYMPCVFGDLSIKGDTVAGIDFYVQQIADAVKCNDSGEFADVLFDAATNGTSFALDFECEGRDGMFGEHQLFAVWEPQDVAGLIVRLQQVTPNVQGEG